DVRLRALFRNPAFIALDQARGTVYASDAGNHVIRRVQPGPNGVVDTLAGSGVTGSRDGAGPEAAFNNPQGMALDGRGHLWVVDTGNHTLRKIDLVTGDVATVAGTAGVPGFTDGNGNAAKFRSPVGIAIETESLDRQLARERRGDPPPP